MIDASELEDYARRCAEASANLKPYMGEALDEIGDEFLDICRDAIMAAGNTDTRALLASFVKGNTNNVYNLDLGALTLTVGTNVQYAKWVNDGHSQRPGRFIPGVWSGDRFTYIPGANTGMVLKADRVEGSKFFDNSVQIINGMFPDLASKSFDRFFARYFN